MRSRKPSRRSSSSSWPKASSPRGCSAPIGTGGRPRVGVRSRSNRSCSAIARPPGRLQPLAGPRRGERASLAADEGGDRGAGLQLVALGPAAQQRLGPRHQRGDLDRDHREEVARELFAVELELHFLDLVTQRREQAGGVIGGGQAVGVRRGP